MPSVPDAARANFNPVSALGQLQTGAKLFLILSAALLPLALIAIFATLQTTRTADLETRAQLRVSSAESARAIAIELVGDSAALRTALNALDDDRGNTQACARARGVFLPQAANEIHFMIGARSGRLLCGRPFATGGAALPAIAPGAVGVRLLPDQGVILTMTGVSGETNAAVLFPVELLATIARPSGFVPPYAAALTLGNERLELTAATERFTLERRKTVNVDLGLSGLALEMSVRSAPITSPVLIALLLPIVMWAAAAGIAWFVVDRLLIGPLRALRTSVATYTPGDIIDPGGGGTLPAQEIRELSDTFRAISRTVALHEADLAAGIVRQTKLTREVHHRVKNNLQVIASLINFHSRSAQGAEAAAAYASIQRRVDALSVVHRNHHAELEDHRGLPLRGMLSELAQSIRATAPDTSAKMAITLDAAPFLISQDTAMAVAFLVTELVELAVTCDPQAKVRISAREGELDRSVIRISSPALIEGAGLRDAIDTRYGRVMQGLARQLRAPLTHDPLVGAFEIAVPVVGVE